MNLSDFSGLYKGKWKVDDKEPISKVAESFAKHSGKSVFDI